ncbi:unnamed protein product [Arctia plantaginis]|uniref:Uncharacterized protein n=1 Tax=Arctia plantaginis TaxID=874455 RepID=A0A8S0ZU26_ARCPL|nr:unnamed protein product [Arctia plantaginis]
MGHLRQGLPNGGRQRLEKRRDHCAREDPDTDLNSSVKRGKGLEIRWLYHRFLHAPYSVTHKMGQRALRSDQLGVRAMSPFRIAPSTN